MSFIECVCRGCGVQFYGMALNCLLYLLRVNEISIRRCLLAIIDVYLQDRRIGSGPGCAWRSRIERTVRCEEYTTNRVILREIRGKTKHNKQNCRVSSYKPRYDVRQGCWRVLSCFRIYQIHVEVRVRTYMLLVQIGPGIRYTWLMLAKTLFLVRQHIRIRGKTSLTVRVCSSYLHFENYCCCSSVLGIYHKPLKC